MNFHWPFARKPEPIPVIIGELRDRCIAAETKALLLEDIVQHRARPKAQPRNEAGQFVSPAIETHHRLINIFMSVTPEVRAAAIERAKSHSARKCVGAE